ncbi:MAG: DUF4113 domain-containing protein [Pedobacter sp.]|nr:MAG: DUF4113 domain-containing protein [Pedobacter sp.]
MVQFIFGGTGEQEWIIFDVDRIVMTNATEELKGPIGFNWQGYSTAANYALQNQTNYEQGMQWIDQAIAQNKAFPTLSIKANLLKAMGKTAEGERLMEEALATYVANAAVKLRSQGSVCAKLFVYTHTSRFAVVNDLYSAGIEVKLDKATNDTGQLISRALDGLRRIYVKGYRYQKVGVELRELKPEGQVQASMFQAQCDKNEIKRQKMLKVVDLLNHEHGKDTIRYATMGYQKKWFMKQEFLSRKYTTKLEDIIVVKAI